MYTCILHGCMCTIIVATWMEHYPVPINLYTIVEQNILWTKICPAWLGHCHRGSGQSLLG